MAVILWVLQILLALVFLAAGGAKAIQSRRKLAANPRMGWVEEFSGSTVRAIGVAEILGALGLILPGLFGIAGWLTPLAALGLAATMVGAFVVHRRRREPSAYPVVLVLAVVSLFVAIMRFAIPV